MSTLSSSILLTALKNRAASLDVSTIADVVLDNPKFPVWSGSSVEGAHHYGDGGLIQHTYEVISLGTENLNWLAWRIPSVKIPTQREMFLAALYHDVGKMWDYVNADGEWTSADHKRKIHHISRSAIEWCKAVEKTNSCRTIEDSVLHAILAHHGRREYGSPVAPKTRLAWLLCLCDQISARMNDCDTNDILKSKE